MTMISNIFIFEDDKYSHFLPLAYLRPVYDLQAGMSPLLAKIVRNFPEANISLHCRDYLKNIVKQNHAGIGVNHINTGMGCLVVNGRLLAGNNLAEVLTLDGRDRIFIDEYEEVVAAYLNTDNLYIVRDMLDDVFSSKKFISALRNKTEITRVKATLVEYPWDLIQAIGSEIDQDFKAAVPSGIIKGELHVSVQVMDEYKIFVGEGTRVLPGVVLNAEKGPIYIGENCTIKPHTYIEGPAYIGNSTTITSSTLLAGAAIGPRSIVVGSEISNTIFHGYSTLEHIKISNSYCADSVDLSRNTFNQDYLSPFSKEPDTYIDGYEVKASVKYLGAMIGDFSTIGPNVMITPGSVMGIGSFFDAGNDTLPKYLPSFINQKSKNRFDELTLKEANEILEHNLGLKDIEFTKAEKDLIEYVYSKFSYDRKISKIVY